MTGGESYGLFGIESLGSRFGVDDGQQFSYASRLFFFARVRPVVAYKNGSSQHPFLTEDIVVFGGF